jgi:general stress protein 26
MCRQPSETLFVPTSANHRNAGDGRAFPEDEIVKETPVNTNDINTFRERLAATNAGLLGTKNGAARMVPMSHQLRDGDATIWFITARDTDLAEAAEQGGTAASYVIAEGGKGLYAVIRGALMQNNDPALRDEIWSTVADTWFKGGKSDPKVCILGLVPESAEVWLTPTSGLSFAFNLLRSQLTGEQPDIGSHGRLSGADLARHHLPS